MTDAMLYRESLSRMTPGPDWRSQTLAAMDAAAAAPVRRRTPVGPLIAAAAALALVAGGGVGVYRNLNAFRPNEYPGGVLSSAPGYTVGTGELPKITLSAAPDLGMGGFDDTMGMLVVRSPEEQRTQNPTLGNTDSLTELPVYQNRIPTEAEQLGCAETVAAALGTGITSYESNLYGQYRSFTSKCTDGTDIWLSNLNECYVLLPESLPLPGGAETLEEAAPHLWRQLAPLYPMVSPKLEATTSYDFYGRASQWFFWFDDDAGKSLTDRLLDYCFGRVGDVSWHEHTGTGIYTFHLPCWPESEGVLYPIRTAAEAEADFRAGDYLGADVPTDTAAATILSTELVYFNQPYQTYIQPVYKITYTQDYWDVSPVLEQFQRNYRDGAGVDPEVEAGVDPNLDTSAFSSVSCAYVPAVAKAYVDMLDAEFQFNN